VVFRLPPELTTDRALLLVVQADCGEIDAVPERRKNAAPEPRREERRDDVVPVWGDCDVLVDKPVGKLGRCRHAGRTLQAGDPTLFGRDSLRKPIARRWCLEGRVIGGSWPDRPRTFPGSRRECRSEWFGPAQRPMDSQSPWRPCLLVGVVLDVGEAVPLALEETSADPETVRASPRGAREPILHGLRLLLVTAANLTASLAAASSPCSWVK
jgi:hypothetical protein